jgi:hypothetical protein
MASILFVIQGKELNMKKLDREMISKVGDNGALPSLIPNKLAQAVTVLNEMWEVHVSILGRNTDYPESLWLLQLLQQHAVLYFF